MRILDRLPVSDKPVQSEVRGEPLKLKPFQIMIQVTVSGIPTWDARTSIVPALLDTGNNHNSSIQERHLTRWVGIHFQSLPFLGKIREGGQTPSLRFANLWIHRNRSGSRDLRVGEPFLLALEEGIAIYPDDESNYPRLPLLGLRAIIKNNLRLVIDGKRRLVSLSSPAW